VPVFASLTLLVPYTLFPDGHLLLRSLTFVNVGLLAFNLLPIYPLDGGLIVNALLGSLSHRLARLWGWIGVLAGLGVALYFQDWLIGIPFLLFAMQHYRGGGLMPDLKRLSFAGGAGLVLAFVATFVLYVAVFAYAEGEKSLISGTDPTAAMSL